MAPKNIFVLQYKSYLTDNKLISKHSMLKAFLVLKVTFIQKGLVNLSFLQKDKPNYFPALNFWFFCHYKWLKSCQIGTWSCSECSNKGLEQLQFLIWHDLSHLEWKQFKILAQENFWSVWRSDKFTSTFWIKGVKLQHKKLI